VAEGLDTHGPPEQEHDDPRAQTRRRRRRVILAAVGVLVLLVVGGLAWTVWHGGKVHEVEVQDAVDRYREGTGTTDGSVQPGPVPGVYSATGSGTEKLSLQSTVRPMGPSMPVTVTRDGDDCWSFRIEFHDAHWQSWHSCFEAGRLIDLGGHVHQHFDFGAFGYDSDTDTVCDPPAKLLPALDTLAAVVPGDSWTQACTIGEGSGASHQEGPATFLGTEVVVVGGVDVQTFHLREERTFTGGQTGQSEDETWFAVDTLLPVRKQWSTHVDTSSPFGGTVSYEEQGSWQIDALVPQQ
jgi:hypothetical protein